MALTFEKHTGHLPRNLKAIADEIRPAVGGAIAGLVKKYGTERIADLMTDSAADQMGEAYAAHLLTTTEHKMVDIGRRIAKSSSDQDAKHAQSFDENLIERTAAPTVNYNPVSYTPKSASDILVGIEHRESASRQYPAKRKK
jgi:hypothetical protein